MRRPGAHGRLTSDQWRRVQDLADRLEDAWSRSEAVALGPLLPPLGDPLRPAALAELVKTDLEIRWRRGRPIHLERYREQFPELGGRPEALADLLYEEYRVRKVHGDRPPLADYEARFPRLFDDLRRLAKEEPVRTPPKAAAAPPPGRPPPAGPGGGDAAPAPAPPASTPFMDSNVVLPIGGGYTLEKLMGRGGFGEVWRARASGGFLVAVKVISRAADHEERHREERALEVVKQLHHHFLIHTHAVYAAQDKLYIIMDLADCSVRDRLKECRGQGQAGIPPDELLAYAREAAEALDYLHGKNVLHRDVKPDNILLVEGHVRLADFGLARHQDQHMVSVSGSGTPAYMAPEVWRGKSGPMSDQYSLAYAYAELRLGRRPFSSTDFAAVMFDHLEHAPDLGNLPDGEKRVLTQALAKKPESRFHTCTDFARALARCFEQEEDSPTYVPSGGAPSRPAPPPERDPRRPAPPPAPSGRTAPAALDEDEPRTQRGDGEDDEPQTERGDSGAEESGTQRFESRPAARQAPPARAAIDKTAVPGADEGEVESVAKTAPAPSPKVKPAPPRRPWAAFLVLLGVIAAGGAAFLVWLALGGLAPAPTPTPPGPKDASIKVSADPPAVALRPGGPPQRVTVSVARKNCDDEVRLTYTKPKGVTAADAVIAAGESKTTVDVKAEPGAPEKKGVLAIHAEVKGLTSDAEVTINVESGAAPGSPYLPPNFKPAGEDVVHDDIADRNLYKEIIFDKGGVPPTPFILVLREKKDDPPSYYVMKTKAPNELVAALRPGLSREKWPPDGGRAKLPAFGLTAAEARDLAGQMGGLLPTAAQWDRAAGYYKPEGRPGPARGERVAVGRMDQGPWPVDYRDTDDISPYGAHDMAGNGTEFTRDPPAANAGPPLVVLRGKRHTAPHALRYDELKEQMQNPELTQVQLEDKASPYTGFRVVVELPAP